MESMEATFSMQSQTEKSQEGIHTYAAQWPIFSIAWSLRRDKTPRLAIGSYLEDYANKVELVHFNHDDTTSKFTTDPRLILDHPYAPTNIMFFPSEDTTNPDLIATSGDIIRLWEIQEDKIQLKSSLIGNKVSDHSAITSFDWAEFDTNVIASSSVDTTCTIWDIEREVMNAQLVAHDKEVYDISWGGFNVFASVSGDGSVRVFDLRDKEKSTIIYENPAQDCPLLRLEWNKSDARFMATVGINSNKVVILDIRLPTTPLMELSKHRTCVNAVSWSPGCGRNLCSVSDDATALIWEVVDPPGYGSTVNGGGDVVEPAMWYGLSAEINHVRWSPVGMDWIALAFLNNLQLLKV